MFVHVSRPLADGGEGQRTTGPTDHTARCTGINHLGQRERVYGQGDGPLGTSGGRETKFYSSGATSRDSMEDFAMNV